jgi:hypothetical protein
VFAEERGILKWTSVQAMEEDVILFSELDVGRKERGVGTNSPLEYK